MVAETGLDWRSVIDMPPDLFATLLRYLEWRADQK